MGTTKGKEETREELLARAATEREARKLARKQLKAAVILQKRFRAWLACGRARQTIGRSYDLQFSNHSQALSAYEIHTLLLRYVFIDVEYFQAICYHV